MSKAKTVKSKARRKPSATVQERKRQSYYLITIRKSRVFDTVKKNELEAIIFVLRITFPEITIVNLAFEKICKYGQLHAHLIIRSRSRLRYSNLKTLQGFYLDYKQLKEKDDVHRAQVYIAKEQYQYLPSGILA